MWIVGLEVCCALIAYAHDHYHPYADPWAILAGFTLAMLAAVLAVSYTAAAPAFAGARLWCLNLIARSTPGRRQKGSEGD